MEPLTVAGIDLGSSKITSIIADAYPDEIIVRAINATPTKSIVKGIVKDLNQCALEIDASLSSAIYSSGVHIEKVYLSLTHKDVFSVPVEGGKTFAESKEITREDVEEFIESVRPPYETRGYLLRRIVREFIVDGTPGIKNPVGMFGKDLSVLVQDVLGPPGLLVNFERIFERLGLKIIGVVPAILSAGEAVLTEEEKETGSILIDLGHGTTDIAIYRDGSPAFTATIPVGGANLDFDLMQGLGVGLEEAQRIKKAFVRAWVKPEPSEFDELIDVKFFGRKEYSKLKKQRLIEVVLPRLEEWAGLIKGKISESGLLPLIPGGVILVGGGCYLRDILSFFNHHLGRPVRIGLPIGFSHLFDEFRAPQYASALGIPAFARLEREEIPVRGLTAWEEFVAFFKDIYKSISSFIGKMR